MGHSGVAAGGVATGPRAPLRLAKRLVVVLTIAAVMWPWGFVSPAHACTCAAVHRPQDVIFDGVARSHDGAADIGDRWTFDASWTYRGEPVAQRSVRLSTGPSSTCGFGQAPAVGTKYRLAGYRNGEEVFVNTCWGSFAELGPPRPMDNFIASAFDDLTWRPSKAERFRHWATALGAGTPRTALVDAIVRSRAYADRRLTSLYRSILRRAASGASASLQAHYLRQGGREEAVRDALLASDEYFGRVGSTQAFVDALYVRLLGRAADAEGRSFWIGQLSRGLVRSEVVSAVGSSIEAVQHTVGRTYQNLLGRAPSRDELSTGTDRVAAEGKLELIGQLTSGGEYLSRASASSS